MIENRYTITSDATDEVELLLARFERERESGPVNLAEYLPPQGDPAYDSVVTELSRIDLEHRFNGGDRPDASCYLRRFPQVFQDPHQRTKLIQTTGSVWLTSIDWMKVLS